MIFGGRSFFGMNASRQRIGRTRRSFSPAGVEEPSEREGEAEFVAKPSERIEQKWSRMFAVNTTGSPRVKSARKFTK